MIAVDTNLLVHAHRRDSSWHDAARNSLRELAVGVAPWAIPWPCVYEFFSVVTHPRIFRPPSTTSQALEQIDAWLESPSIRLLSEAGGETWPPLREVLAKAAVRGPLVHDARVAMLCLEHGVRELWTADRDFSRFPGLRWRHPLS